MTRAEAVKEVMQARPRQSWLREMYYPSEHWRRFRLYVLSTRDRCERCNLRNERSQFLFGRGLDVHHLRYCTLFSETHEDVRVLCRACHDVEEQVLLGGPDALLNAMSREMYGRTISNALSINELQDMEDRFLDAVKIAAETGMKLNEIKGIRPREDDVLNILFPLRRFAPVNLGRPYLVQ